MKYIEMAVKDGAVNALDLYYLGMKSLSDRYNWPPDVIERQNIRTLMAYRAMLSGEKEALDERGKKNV